MYCLLFKKRTSSHSNVIFFIFTVVIVVTHADIIIYNLASVNIIIISHANTQHTLKYWEHIIGKISNRSSKRDSITSHKHLVWSINNIHLTCKHADLQFTHAVVHFHRFAATDWIYLILSFFLFLNKPTIRILVLSIYTHTHCHWKFELQCRLFMNR